MASSKPESLDAAASLDECFRQLTGRMASTINSLGAGRLDGMKIPPQHVNLKKKIRTLIGEPAKGHFDDPANRIAFWREIDYTLGAIKPYENDRQQAWLRAVCETVKTHRQRSSELFNGNGRKSEVYKTPEAMQWGEYKRFIKARGEAGGAGGPETEELFCNLDALSESIIRLYEISKGEGVSEQEAENLIFEMLQTLENFRADGVVETKRKAYESCLAILERGIEAGPVPDYLKEFYEHEIGEYRKLMADIPEKIPVTETPEEPPTAKEDPIPFGFGPIERLEGNTDFEAVKKMAQALSEAIDREPDADRIRQLFRHNVHEFMDAMAELTEDLFRQNSQGLFSRQLWGYMRRRYKSVFVTTIADVLINKIGWTTLKRGREFGSNEVFFKSLHLDKNRMGETCFENTALVTFSALTSKKSKDIKYYLLSDAQARNKLKHEMSLIDAKSFKEHGNEEDLKGGTDYEFVTEEVEWLIRFLETGIADEVESVKLTVKPTMEQKKPESLPVFEAARVTEMVQKLVAGLDELEIRRCELANTKAEILDRMAGLENDLAAENQLTALRVKEREHKAEMPAFESEEFRIWSQEGLRLGEKIRLLQDRIEAGRNGTKELEELEDEKICLEEDLAGAEYDMKETDEEIGLIKDRLQKIAALCI